MKKKTILSYSEFSVNENNNENNNDNTNIIKTFGFVVTWNNINIPLNELNAENIKRFAYIENKKDVGYIALANSKDEKYTYSKSCSLHWTTNVYINSSLELSNDEEINALESFKTVLNILIKITPEHKELLENVINKLNIDLFK